MTGSFGDGIPIPDVIDPPDSMPMTLCIPRNRDHMAAFFGALYQLTIWNSWQQDGTTHGKELAAVWWRYFLSWNRTMNDLECEDGMGNCCTEPAIIKRVNPTTGNVEQSTDGGSTWTPAAGGFQSVIVSPVPPVTSGVAATKCDAATNVSGQVQVWIDQVSNDFTTATTLLEFGLAVIGAIAAAVLTVLTDGALIAVAAQAMAVLGASLAAVWGVGKTVFDDYWTTDIKDKILCAAYCNIGEDGSFSPAQFTAFWNKLNATLPPSPAKMLFMGFLSNVGVAGLNAMAASGMAADADCGDCDCEGCNVENWAVGDWLNDGTYQDWSIHEVSRTADSITVQSWDRGDGQEIINFTNLDRVSPCSWTATFIGGTPSSIIKNYNDAPNIANIQAGLTTDNTGSTQSHLANAIYFQMDPNASHWTVKFTVAP
ncbi:MAG: hypothetical protein V4490_08585 [Pseudomonadota bacterium]